MESTFVSVLPNLSIGVIPVLSLVFVSHKFLEHLKEERIAHSTEIKEREQAMREVEKEVRTSIMAQLAENTSVMKEVVKLHNLK